MYRTWRSHQVLSGLGIPMGVQGSPELHIVGGLPSVWWPVLVHSFVVRSRRWRVQATAAAAPSLGLAFDAGARPHDRSEQIRAPSAALRRVARSARLNGRWRLTSLTARLPRPIESSLANRRRR